MEKSDFAKETSENPLTPEEVLRISLIILKDLFPQKQILKLQLKNTLDHTLELDSLARVEFLARIEKHFNAHFSDKDFVEIKNLEDIFFAVLKSKGYTDSIIRKEVKILENVQEETVPSNATTLNEVLYWHCKNHPEKIHTQFYMDSKEGPTLSYFQLKQMAESIAAGLQKLKLEKGENIILMLPTGQEYLCSFFGVLLAGCVPVPIYPLARPDQLEDHIHRHRYILSNCNASLIIAPKEVKPIARLLKIQVPTLKKIVSMEELKKNAEQYQPQQINSSDLALIQYTSGSTGTPKGVMLTHQNILANIRSMGDALEVRSTDVIISWLPLYHDMGLIGTWLGSLYYSIPLILMSSLSFLAHPERWLWAIHRYGGTITAAPNFAYELCLHRIKEQDLDKLDLSSLRALLNGAEAVIPETLDLFVERFQKYGLNKKALMPVYGLAESCVGLCFPPVGRGPVVDYIDRQKYTSSAKAITVATTSLHALRFVGCGFPLPGHQIRIVDSLQHELPENEEGEIQFRGPSATSGYFSNKDQTKKLFSDSWLKTGDRGYIARGELFVTGRIKDIIIRGGRNIYPQEIENIVGNHQRIRKGRVVAFGSTDLKSGTEKLVIVAETYEKEPKTLEKLKININKIISDLVGDPAEEIILTRPGTILKTSSGKLRRSATKELYEKGDLGFPPRALWKQVLALVFRGFSTQFRFFIKNINRHLYSFYCWVCFVVVAPIAWSMVIVIPKLQWRWKSLSWAAKLLFKITGTKINVNGHHILLSKPLDAQILVVNHSSYLDSLVLISILPSPICFVAKKELSQNPFLALPLKRLSTHFVERFEIEKSLNDIMKIEKSLDAGKSFLFFPEGTFSRSPGLLPLHTGAFYVAAKKNVPLIPLYIHGTRQILPSDSWSPRHGSIHIYIGEYIDPFQVSKETAKDIWQKADVLKNYSRDYMQSHNQEPRTYH